MRRRKTTETKEKKRTVLRRGKRLANRGFCFIASLLTLVGEAIALDGEGFRKLKKKSLRGGLQDLRIEK